MIFGAKDPAQAAPRCLQRTPLEGVGIIDQKCEKSTEERKVSEKGAAQNPPLFRVEEEVPVPSVREGLKGCCLVLPFLHDPVDRLLHGEDQGEQVIATEARWQWGKATPRCRCNWKA